MEQRGSDEERRWKKECASVWQDREGCASGEEKGGDERKKREDEKWRRRDKKKERIGA